MLTAAQMKIFIGVHLVLRENRDFYWKHANYVHSGWFHTEFYENIYNSSTEVSTDDWIDGSRKRERNKRDFRALQGDCEIHSVQSQRPAEAWSVHEHLASIFFFFHHPR